MNQLPELPRGTVTFLFSDIEGSTSLLRELGQERYGEALAEYQRLLRDACTECDGREVDTQGDCVLLRVRAREGRGRGRCSSAACARGARVAGRHAATGTDRPPYGPGVGHGSRYVGLSVHRAARVVRGGRPEARCCSHRRRPAFSRTTISASFGCALSAVTRSRTSTGRWSCTSSTCPGCASKFARPKTKPSRRPSRRLALGGIAAAAAGRGCCGRSARARWRGEHHHRADVSRCDRPERRTGSSTRSTSAPRRR